MINYEKFANSEIQNLISIQNKFKEIFKIDSYENWFFDGETEILRFYNSGEDEIFFKYITIGTYSLKSKTWMWSWFNDSSIEKSKEQTLKIRHFGIENKYSKLTQGTFPSDEYDGWDFLAIGLETLGGIGVYKANSENLEKYMLLINVLDSKNSNEIKKFKQKKIDCNNHGFSRPAFVCQHLDLKKTKGFVEAFETFEGMDLEDDDDFQAWCNECEEVRKKYDGWNEESEKFAKIKLVCEKCYFELKKYNTTN